MFANQVIKSLQKEIELRENVVSVLKNKPELIETMKVDVENEKHGLKYLHSLRYCIENSVQYYLGDYDTWKSSLMKTLGRSIFNNIDIKLPYPYCTFSFTHNQGKLKVFVYTHYVPADDKISDHIVMSISFKPQEQSDWFHYQACYTYLLHGAFQDLYSDYKILPKASDYNNDDEKNGNVFVSFYDKDHIALREENRSLIATSSAIVEKVLEFLQCRNASSEYVYLTKSQSFNKIPQKERPFFRYKVLKVLVPKSRKVYVYDKTIPPMETMPVHLVPGHPKTYSEDKPLFGKYSGKWWWQPFLRGSSKNGFVTKDYCVSLKQ